MVQTSLLSFIGDLRRTVEKRIEEFLDQFKPRWLYVEFSGGKDSAAVLAAARNVTDKVIAIFLHIAGQTVQDNATAALRVAEKLGLRMYKCVCRRRGDLRRFFENARPEPPAMVYAIVVDYTLSLPYWEAVRRIGWPVPGERWGSGKRWCCNNFKAKWLAERPSNGRYLGRPARFLAVGIRRDESPYRARLWEGRIWQVFSHSDGTVDVALAPLADMSEADVWSLLKHYNLYDILWPQYVRWGRRAPNCVLCPLMGKESLQVAVKHLPTSYLENVLRVLEELRPRYREGTFSAKRIDEWMTVIKQELERRGKNTVQASPAYR